MRLHPDTTKIFSSSSNFSTEGFSQTIPELALISYFQRIILLSFSNSIGMVSGIQNIMIKGTVAITEFMTVSA
ncbi:hypothetical protein AVEN_113104-1, partial [Araneus ventricosus]